MMPDEPDPPRKCYGFKPVEFEKANELPKNHVPSGESPPAPDPGITPVDQGRIDVRELARLGAGDGPQLGVNAVVNRDNEVHAILRDNLTRADAAGLNDVAPRPKRRSKRKRDYFICLLGGNAVLGFGFVLNPVFAGAGIIIFNLGLTWIMWAVMDDY